MLKLNLGSGPEKKEGYVNVDVMDGADLVHDLTNPLPYPSESVDEIFASHIIEHFSPYEWPAIKKDWYRVLINGGLLYIQCPDVIKASRQFLYSTDFAPYHSVYHKRWSCWVLAIYGNQFEPGQLHRNGFDLIKLSKELEEAGFIIEGGGHKGTNSIDVFARKPDKGDRDAIG